MSAQILQFRPRPRAMPNVETVSRNAVVSGRVEQPTPLTSSSCDDPLRRMLERADTRVRRWLLLAVGRTHKYHEID